MANANGPANGPAGGIMSFVGRFHELQSHRDSEKTLLTDLLIYTEEMERTLRQTVHQLEQELKDMQFDIDDAKKSRRDLQQQLMTASAKIAEATSQVSRNPYLIVLIDGDGMIFNSDHIKQGVEGGKQAARDLQNAVRELCHDLKDEIEIVANVYANAQGLSNALLRDGSDDIDQMKNFMVGFTQGKASFNFIDVGHGKERADSKIKELTRWHLRNYNCKQVLLGISHDAGYAPFLDDVIKPEDRDRVTIIEGPPTCRELKSMGLQVINFNKIFRGNKISNDRPTGSFDRTEANNFPSLATWAGVTSTPPVPSASPTLIKNGVPKKPTPTLSSAKPAWQPQPRGFDPQINVNAVVLDKIKRRTNNNKLCNNHYLRGPCAKGDDCCFEHKYKANEEDLKAIAYLTRLNPCLNGQDCDLEFCIYGHHCPSVTYGGVSKIEPICLQFNCRFGQEDHPPGTKIKHPRKEEWERTNYY